MRPPRHNMRTISGVGASSPILHFFIGGGVALHERLVGKEITRPGRFFFSIREHTSNRSYAVDYSVLQYAARCDCAGFWY